MRRRRPSERWSALHRWLLHRSSPNGLTKLKQSCEGKRCLRWTEAIVGRACPDLLPLSEGELVHFELGQHEFSRLVRIDAQLDEPSGFASEWNHPRIGRRVGGRS